MIIAKLLAVISAMTRLAVAQSSGSMTIAGGSPAQTEAFLLAASSQAVALGTQYSSLLEAVATALPSSVYTDYLSTQPFFGLASFAQLTTADLAPWVTLLPSSLETVFAPIETSAALELESIARSILAESSLASASASSSTTSGLNSAQFSNTIPAFSMPVSSQQVSTTASANQQPSGNSQPSASSSSSHHNAAATGGVKVVKVAGAALGAAVVAVAVL